jgi:hypothetical protein
LGRRDGALLPVSRFPADPPGAPSATPPAALTGGEPDVILSIKMQAEPGRHMFTLLNRSKTIKSLFGILLVFYLVCGGVLWWMKREPPVLVFIMLCSFAPIFLIGKRTKVYDNGLEVIIDEDTGKAKFLAFSEIDSGHWDNDKLLLQRRREMFEGQPVSGFVRVPAGRREQLVDLLRQAGVCLG